MKKIFRIFFIIAFIIAFIFGISNFYLYVKNYPVTINEKTYNTRNQEELIHIIEEDYNNHSFITENELISFRNINVHLDEIPNNFWEIFINDCIKEKTYHYEIEESYDYDAISDYLSEKNKSMVSSLNASISYNDINNEYEIIKEIQGTVLDVDKYIDDFKIDKSISFSDYYIKPTVSENDLLDEYQDYLDYKNWKIIYSNGAELNIPNDKIFYDGIVFSVDDSFIDDIIDEILIDYNTVGKNISFHTTEDGEIDVKNITWGNTVDFDKEKSYIKNLLNHTKSEYDRTPIYETQRDDIGDTYIEVNKDKQHIWVYIDEELWGESDCVTGNLTNHDTPVGVYYISECINGKYLTGPGYKTWVNKWMRLTNSGIGLHDASWRKSFGGNIYKKDGSHGCVNLPKKFAYDLYDISYVGMPVIIY